MLHHLLSASFNVRCIERDSLLGGTWNWNRYGSSLPLFLSSSFSATYGCSYPGARVDHPSNYYTVQEPELWYPRLCTHCLALTCVGTSGRAGLRSTLPGRRSWTTPTGMLRGSVSALADRQVRGPLRPARSHHLQRGHYGVRIQRGDAPVDCGD